MSDLVVVGLAGTAGVGKTATAQAIAPQASMGATSPSKGEVAWTHLYFALPLYEMATMRQHIEGELARDRMKYGIHQVLLDAFGSSPLYGAPTYDDLIKLVEEIASYPVPRDGSKPRRFLQYVGTDLCRARNEHVWVNWMRKKIDSEYRNFVLQKRLEGLEYEDMPLFGVVISDVRFPNEAQLIKSYDNGVLIRFTADPEVVRERQQDRDGEPMSIEHANHSSETSIDLIDESMYDATIDTSNIAMKEQVSLVHETIRSFI